MCSPTWRVIVHVFSQYLIATTGWRVARHAVDAFAATSYELGNGYSFLAALEMARCLPMTSIRAVCVA